MRFDKFAGAIVETIAKAIAGPQVQGRFEAHEARIAALEKQPFLKDAGTWRHGSAYRPGDVAQFKGKRWVCRKAHTGEGSPEHEYWQLWDKTIWGKD